MKRPVGYGLPGFALACAFVWTVVPSAAAEKTVASDWREPPLLSIDVERVVLARDFGAVPDDGRDDLPTIIEALSAALEAGPGTELRFDKGRYDLLGAPDTERPLLTITGARDFVFNGNRADFVVHDSRRKLLSVFNDNERVIVKSFSLDYDPRPVSQGRVVALDKAADTMRVAFDPAYPDLDNGFFERGKKWAIIKDRDNPRRTKNDMPSIWNVLDWKRVAPHTFDIRMARYLREHFDAVAVDDPYVAVNRSGGGLFTFKSKRVTWMDARVYSSGAIAFLDMRNDLVSYVRCRVEAPERCWHTTGADGIYALYGRTGPWIEDCVFDALGDDALVIKGYGAHCLRRVDERTLVLSGRLRHDDKPGSAGPAFPARMGDRLIAFDPVACAVVGEAKVVAIKPLEGANDAFGPQQVTIDRPMPNLVPGTKWQSHILYNDDARGGGFVIRNNVLRNIRRWGLNCMSRDGLVDGNQFIACQNQAIILHNADLGHHASDGFAARDIMIRHNLIEDCFHVARAGTNDGNAGMVSSLIRGVTDKPNRFLSSVGEWRGIERVVFDGNTLRNWRSTPALSLSNVNGLALIDNSFDPGEASQKQAIHIRNSGDVERSANEIDGQHENHKETMLIEGD